MVLGGGSNMLFTQDFNGLVIWIANKGFSERIEGNSVVLKAAAGEVWNDLVHYAVNKGFAGMENLSLIPGTVGASPVQNIGAYGHEVGEFITLVRTYDRQKKELKTFTNSECNFSYRNSIFKSEPGRYVVLDVAFQIRQGEMSEPITYAELATKLGIEIGERAPVKKVRESVLELRGAKGMLLSPTDKDSWSAGSFFTNPIVSTEIADQLPADAPRWPTSDGHVKTSAAWLIQQSGIQKGQSHGGAKVSTKHVLALTNSGNATAAEITELAKIASAAVKAKFGIELQPEVNLVGITW